MGLIRAKGLDTPRSAEGFLYPTLHLTGWTRAGGTWIDVSIAAAATVREAASIGRLNGGGCWRHWHWQGHTFVPSPPSATPVDFAPLYDESIWIESGIAPDGQCMPWTRGTRRMRMHPHARTLQGPQAAAIARPTWVVIHDERAETDPSSATTRHWHDSTGTSEPMTIGRLASSPDPGVWDITRDTRKIWVDDITNHRRRMWVEDLPRHSRLAHNAGPAMGSREDDVPGLADDVPGLVDGDQDEERGQATAEDAVSEWNATHARRMWVDDLPREDNAPGLLDDDQDEEDGGTAATATVAATAFERTLLGSGMRPSQDPEQPFAWSFTKDSSRRLQEQIGHCNRFSEGPAPAQGGPEERTTLGNMFYQDITSKPEIMAVIARMSARPQGSFDAAMAYMGGVPRRVPE